MIQLHCSKLTLRVITQLSNSNEGRRVTACNAPLNAGIVTTASVDARKLLEYTTDLLVTMSPEGTKRASFLGSLELLGRQTVDGLLFR